MNGAHGGGKKYVVNLMPALVAWKPPARTKLCKSKEEISAAALAYGLSASTIKKYEKYARSHRHMF